MTQIIAIDPGIGKVGYAVIDVKKQKQFDIVEYGVIVTSLKDNVEMRLNTIYNDIKEILNKYPKIQVCVTEKIFFVNNVTNGIVVSMAKGVILLAFAQYNVPIYEYSPMCVKKTITGYGMADKLAIRKMLQKMCPKINLQKQDDALDAIAIGITYLINERYV